MPGCRGKPDLTLRVNPSRLREIFVKRSLLVISCTGAKDKTPGFLPAVMRYKGPLYPTLHKAMREKRFPKSLDILIVSAKYGLLTSDELIEDYDKKIDAKRAKELRPSVQEKLEAFLDGKGYDQFFNRLWKDYQAVLEGFDFEQHFENVVSVETNRGKRCLNLKHGLQICLNLKQRKNRTVFVESLLCYRGG